MEEWRDIEGYEGLYKISSIGRVKSLDRINNYGRTVKGRILKNYKSKNGYLVVNLNKDGKADMYYVHRLVAQAFIYNIENKPFVDHINTIKTDNRVENLRWCTNKENLNNPLTKKRLSGENNPMYGKKLKLETIQKIRKANTKGKVYCPELNMTFDSTHDVIRKCKELFDIKLNASHISGCVLNKRKAHGIYKNKKLTWIRIN